MPEGENVTRFRNLHERYQAAIYNYCARRAPAGDAADATADTFVVAWRRLAEVPDGDEALLWLYRVARRALANQRRGLARYRRLIERLSNLPIEMTSPDETTLVTGEHTDLVLEALRGLPERDQEILRLVAWEELSRPDIALTLGCSRAVVDQRYHRALKRLETELVRRGFSFTTGKPFRPQRAGGTR